LAIKPDPPHHRDELVPLTQPNMSLKEPQSPLQSHFLLPGSASSDLPIFRHSGMVVFIWVHCEFETVLLVEAKPTYHRLSISQLLDMYAGRTDALASNGSSYD